MSSKPLHERNLMRALLIHFNLIFSQMNITQELVKIVEAVLGTDNERRKIAEADFNTIRDRNPSEFMRALVQLCKNSDVQIRTFCAVHMTNCLNSFAPKNFKYLWPELDPQTQEYLKEEFFVLLSQETTPNVRNQFCDCIAKLGGTSLSGNNDWPKMLPTLWQMFLSPRNEIIEAGFNILKNLFIHNTDIFVPNLNDIGILFNQGLLNGDIRIKTASLECIGSYVTSTEYKQNRMFEDLVPLMIKSTYDVLILDQILGEQCLEVFVQITECNQYKFLRKHFKDFFVGIQTIFREPKIQIGVKRIGTESMIQIVERQPKIFRNNENYIHDLVEMIFYHMIQISQTVSETWKSPMEGFNDDTEQDEDLETIRFGMHAVDRLTQKIGESIMLPILSQIVQQLLQHEDWRYKYAAIMALSQVGEYVKEISEINPIIELIMSMHEDPNPMIRYAVCHAIGQIADDMKPIFQSHYMDIILPKLINRLYIDDVPRVVSHILACLTNFVEGAKKGIDPFSQRLVTRCVELLQNGISIVKENAISVIAATAEATQKNFIPYLEQLMPYLFNVLESHQGKEYKQLKGQCIEAITLIASSVKKQAFQPYLELSVAYMILIQEGQIEQSDPCKSYLLSGWQRLCLICPDQLVAYLPRILPGLFKTVSQIFSLDKSDGQIQKVSYHTYHHEEAEVAISMISVFVEQMGAHFFAYFDTATQLIVPLCSFSSDDTIRISASKCLVSLIHILKKNGQVIPLVQGAKYFLSVLVDSASKDPDPDVIRAQIKSMKQIFDITGVDFLSANDINDLSEKVFKLLLDSDKRKTENENIVNDEECDEDEIKEIKKENEREEELHVNIALFIGVLFKTHKQYVQPLCDVITGSILPRVLDPKLSPKIQQFGLCLINAIIEFLGFNYMPEKFGYFANALNTFALNKHSFVRFSALYGIGMFALQTPKVQNLPQQQEYFSAYGQAFLECIVASLKVQQGDRETQREFLQCRDQTVGALGKILWAQPESLNQEFFSALQTWLRLLPLRAARSEAAVQVLYLCDHILNHGEKLLDGQWQNALQVFKVTDDVLGSKVSDKEIDSKIQAAVKYFSSLETVSTNMQNILNLMPSDQQQRIILLCKSIN